MTTLRLPLPVNVTRGPLKNEWKIPVSTGQTLWLGTNMAVPIATTTRHLVARLPWNIDVALPVTSIPFKCRDGMLPCAALPLSNLILPRCNRPCIVWSNGLPGLFELRTTIPTAEGIRAALCRR